MESEDITLLYFVFTFCELNNLIKVLNMLVDNI